MEIGDAAAVALARTGDSDAFRLLVERHSRRVFRLAYRLTGSEADAEDIVQETFLRAYRNLDRFEERAVVGSWLYRIATNCALDLIRSKKRRWGRAGGAPAGQPAGAGAGGDGRAGATRGSSRAGRADDAGAGGLHPAALRGARHRGDQRDLADLGQPTKQAVFRAVQKLRRALQPLHGAPAAAEGGADA